MKKIILFLICLVLIPCVLTFGFSLFNKDVRIGNGGNTLENKHMGKEILIEMNGLYKSLDVEEFVLGILPGTIPADYDMEALMVQAVLIRTNVLKEMQEKNTTDAADLSYHYLTAEEQTAIWGERNYDNYQKRMERAVVKTAGKVIEQENSLIMALYHEVSIGKTANAIEILGEDISYLQSVESSQDVEAKHYMNIITYTWEELTGLLNGTMTSAGEGVPAESETAAVGTEVSVGNEATTGTEVPTENGEAAVSTETQVPVESSEAAAGTEASAGGSEAAPETSTENMEGKIEVKVKESTENGFVKRLLVAGNSYTGEQAMQSFQLASTNFYVEEIEGGVRFVCLGKGNCLGISQYGANHLALNGKKMEEIIKYYYKGVSLSEYGK